jgi:hypothetical protein
MTEGHCETGVEMAKLERKKSITFASAFNETSCAGGTMMTWTLCHGKPTVVIPLLIQMMFPLESDA